MANYSLVVNSKFRPFEYQELMAPVLMATQAHQALEDTYSELGTKASVFDKMANETTDPKAYSIYKKYSDDLNAQAEQLSKYGLNPTSRQNMMNMRARYAKDIIPIETAYKKREADAKAQAEMMMKDPTHFFNRQASNISLDEYMANPMLDVLSTNYSGALLQQQVSQAAAALKNTIMKKGAITSLGLPYQYERALQKGATPDEVLAAMAKDPNALPILNKLVDDTMAASGIRNWSSMNGDWVNNPMYQRAEAYARQGLMSAIGTTDYQAFKDDAGLARLHADLQDRNNARQHARQVAENKRQEAVQAAAQQQRMKMNSVRPTTFYSKDDIAKMNEGKMAQLTEFQKAGYFDKSGKLTERGLKALQSKPITNPTGKKGGAMYAGWTPQSISGNNSVTKFQRWAKDQGVNLSSGYDIRTKVGPAYRNQMQAFITGELPTGTANFEVYRHGIKTKANRDYLKEQVTNIIKDSGKIYEAGALKNGKVTNGHGYSAKEFEALVAENPIVFLDNAPTVGDVTKKEYGQQFIELSNGMKFLIPSPKKFFDEYSYAEMNSANEKIRNAKSVAERAAEINRSNYNMMSPLISTDGAVIQGDGTIDIDLYGNE